MNISYLRGPAAKILYRSTAGRVPRQPVISAHRFIGTGAGTGKEQVPNGPDKDYAKFTKFCEFVEHGVKIVDGAVVSTLESIIETTGKTVSFLIKTAEKNWVGISPESASAPAPKRPLQKQIKESKNKSTVEPAFELAQNAIDPETVYRTPRKTASETHEERLRLQQELVLYEQELELIRLEKNPDFQEVDAWIEKICQTQKKIDVVQQELHEFQEQTPSLSSSPEERAGGECAGDPEPAAPSDPLETETNEKVFRSGTPISFEKPDEKAERIDIKTPAAFLFGFGALAVLAEKMREAAEEKEAAEKELSIETRATPVPVPEEAPIEVPAGEAGSSPQAFLSTETWTKVAGVACFGLTAVAMLWNARS